MSLCYNIWSSPFFVPLEFSISRFLIWWITDLINDLQYFWCGRKCNYFCGMVETLDETFIPKANMICSLFWYGMVHWHLLLVILLSMFSGVWVDKVDIFTLYMGFTVPETLVWLYLYLKSMAKAYICKMMNCVLEIIIQGTYSPSIHCGSQEI